MFGRYLFARVVFGRLQIIGSGNAAPIISAGTAQSLPALTTSTLLTGSASDADGDTLTVTWSLVSGPNSPVISSPNSLSTGVSGMIAGTYVFRLTVSDGVNPDVTNDVSVTIAASSNLVVSAGDKVLPYNSIKTNLKGSAIGVSPTATKLWAQISGPGIAVIKSPTSWTTTVDNLMVGTYVFRLTVTDGPYTVYDDVTVTRLPHTRGRGSRPGV